MKHVLSQGSPGPESIPFYKVLLQLPFCKGKLSVQSSTLLQGELVKHVLSQGSLAPDLQTLSLPQGDRSSSSLSSNRPKFFSGQYQMKQNPVFRRELGRYSGGTGAHGNGMGQLCYLSNKVFTSKCPMMFWVAVHSIFCKM